jgi:hypothetical protein
MSKSQSPEPSTPSVTLNTPNVQLVTPPTGGTVDSEGNALDIALCKISMIQQKRFMGLNIVECVL